MLCNEDQTHWQKLENMYLAAPCNAYYKPQISICEGKCTILQPVRPDLYHAAQAVHGAAYFKAIDDAAYFAASSLVKDVFILTVSLNCYLVRAITTGQIMAGGRVTTCNRSLILAETILTNSDGKEIGRGTGSFVRGKTPLEQVPGYNVEKGTNDCEI